jgi:hypothetical protein
VPEANLEAAGIKIVVIGCGEWRGLAHYKENTGFNGPLYADSKRKLYFTLGMDIQTMASTPSGQQKPSYIKDSVPQTVWKSIKVIYCRSLWSYTNILLGWNERSFKYRSVFSPIVELTSLFQRSPYHR